MKQPGTLLPLGDREYLFIEGGFNERTRTVSLMCRSGDPGFPQKEGTVPVSWLDQGEWFPVARWAAQTLTLHNDQDEAQKQRAQESLDRYLDHHHLPPEMAWALRLDDDELRGEITSALPLGVAVPLFDQIEHTEDVVEGKIEPITNLGLFLTHLVREGYAGALWNGTAPIYFCADEDGDLHYLRVQPGDDNSVIMETLTADNQWQDYEGGESIAVLDNRDAFDQRLLTNVGSVPLVEWPEDGTLYCVGPQEGVPGVLVDEGDRMRYGILFTQRHLAEEFVESEETDWTVFELLTSEISELLRKEELAESIVHLNPGQHRAMSGLLWSDGIRVILDSFSGFWALEGSEFSALDEIENPTA